MSVDSLWPLCSDLLGAIGALVIAWAPLPVSRWKNGAVYQVVVSTGALFIAAGFLLQALPYIAKEQPLLIARLVIIILFLASAMYIILRYGYRHTKKSPPKSAGKPEIKHTQANQIPSTEAVQGSFMKNIWKFWRFIAVILLIVLPTIVQLFIPPALWILILIAIGAIIIFIGSFITETRELPDKKSRLAYLVVPIVFFVVTPPP